MIKDKDTIIGLNIKNKIIFLYYKKIKIIDETNSFKIFKISQEIGYTKFINEFFEFVDKFVNKLKNINYIIEINK